MEKIFPAPSYFGSVHAARKSANFFLFFYIHINCHF